MRFFNLHRMPWPLERADAFPELVRPFLAGDSAR